MAYSEWRTFLILTALHSLLSLDAKIIEELPTILEVPFGEDISLKCMALSSSDQNTTCQWLKDEMRQKHFDDAASRYQMASGISGNCTLTISNFQPMDEGNWQCIVILPKSAIPVHFKKFLLTLRKSGYHGPRQFVSQPKNMTVAAGQNITLECSFNTKSPNCYWIKDGDIIGIGGRYSNIGDRNDGNCSINIINARFFDFGKWQCCYPRTDEEEGLKSNASHLYVTVAPSDPVITVNGRAMANGDTLYLSTMNPQFKVSCWSENGIPAAKLQWRIRTNFTQETSLTSRDHTRNYPSALHTSLFIAELPFDHSYQGPWQQQELLCYASHPSYGEKDHIAKIQFLMAYSPPPRRWVVRF